MIHWYPIILLVMAATVAIGLDTLKKTAKRRNQTWDELLNQIRPLNISGVEGLAKDHLHPVKGAQLDIEPYKMWSMIGGIDGLETMNHNARIICELSAYAIRWNYVEAVIVTERIRREAAVVRKAVMRASRYGTIHPLMHARSPFDVFEAATAYHLMRARLLALYETSHAGLYPRLLEAL